MQLLLVSFFKIFKWCGQAFDFCRLPGFRCQLSWSGQVGWLPSCVQVIGLSQIQGLVVLCVQDSADLKVPLRSACLEG